MPSVEWTQQDVHAFVHRVVARWSELDSGVHSSDALPGSTNDGLTLHDRDGRAISITLPGMPLETFVAWFGRRLVCWEHGIEGRQRISVVSSRVGERKDEHSTWFEMLRTAVLRCHSDQQCLCVVEGTATAEAVGRASELFGLPRLHLTCANEAVSHADQLADWCLAWPTILSDSDAERSEFASAALLSPELVSEDEAISNRVVPVVSTDGLLVGAADRTIVLRCRTSGIVHGLVERKLTSPVGASVLVSDHDSSVTAPTLKHLQSLGAVPWLLHGFSDRPRYGVQTSVDNSSRTRHSEPVADGPLQQPELWLCHWTRHRRGPWPDESQNDYLDALLLGCASADHSAFAALLRILESARLRTSSLSRQTVSFTEVPLSEFRQRRVYRRHLRRYDFEAWGIAVRRDVLESLGALPVQYLDPDQNESNAQPIWQAHPATDTSGAIDWTEEREWRLPSDLLLHELKPTDITVFVDRDVEMKVVQQAASWNVVAIPAGPKARPPA